jgi:hypothetical protein
MGQSHPANAPVEAISRSPLELKYLVYYHIDTEVSKRPETFAIGHPGDSDDSALN